LPSSATGSSRRFSWKQVFDPSNRFAPPRRIAQGWLLLFATLGAAGVLGTFYYSAKTIQAFVWEGHFRWSTLIVVFNSLFFSLQLLTSLLREQAATLGFHPASEVSELPAEQGEKILAELYADRKGEATRLYLEATGASSYAARRAIGQLASEHYRVHPERFAADPTRPPPVNPVRALVLLFAGCTALGIGSLCLPERMRPSWPAQFAAGSAMGWCIMWVRGFRNTWLRPLCILAVTSSSVFLFLNLPGAHDSPDAGLPWLLGVGSGITLIWAARRKPSAPRA
jgi:hypothetical protein